MCLVHIGIEILRGNMMTDDIGVLRACLRSKTLALVLAENRIRILEERLAACNHRLDISVGGAVYLDEVRKLQFREAELERLVASLRGARR